MYDENDFGMYLGVSMLQHLLHASCCLHSYYLRREIISWLWLKDGMTLLFRYVM